MTATARIMLGIDVGGSSIKGGLVDIDAGLLQGELKSAPTPRPAAPAPVMAALAESVLRRHAVVLNDADAAWIAGMRFGAGRDLNGVVLMPTFGTGIGTALFVKGKLLPNTEWVT